MKYIGFLVLAVILLLSSITYSYTLFFTQKSESTKLPNEKIVNYLNQNQIDLAMQQGFTLIFYNFTKENEVKSYLENFVLNNQAYLIENRGNEDVLLIQSLKGARLKYNPSLNETVDTLCEVNVYTPLDCTLREIK